jgi:shikimate dehydrogenase
VRITGKTKILFILADPVDHVVGTHLLNQRFEAEGRDVAVSPLHVAPQDLATVLESLRRMRNVAGFGVTIPHKIAVIPLLDRMTGRAARVGSVNFVRRELDGTLTGDNLDGAGFVDGLAHCGIQLRGRRVLQIGAGGAGRAVAFAIAEAGAVELAIHNRTLSTAQTLADEVADAHPACATHVGDNDPEGFDVVVNTTSMGMQPGDPIPVRAERLASGAAVADIIMHPEHTPLLVEAQSRGCRIAPGRFMLIEQFKMVKELLGLHS